MYVCSKRHATAMLSYLVCYHAQSQHESILTQDPGNRNYVSVSIFACNTSFTCTPSGAMLWNGWWRGTSGAELFP